MDSAGCHLGSSREGGAGRGGVGLIFGPAKEPRARLHGGEVGWGLHAGRLDTLRKGDRKELLQSNIKKQTEWHCLLKQGVRISYL